MRWFPVWEWQTSDSCDPHSLSPLLVHGLDCILDYFLTSHHLGSAKLVASALKTTLV